MLPDLFPEPDIRRDGFAVLRGYALPQAEALLAEIERVTALAPFRHMTVPGGGAMSVAMTNAGMGWTAGREGYSYSRNDPQTGQPWPDLPDVIRQLAVDAAGTAGFGGFAPDGCLINRYAPGAKMGLHQDRDEAEHNHPIVSISLGLPATFLWGGRKRSDPVEKIALNHGDVVVWGGPDRLSYHGVAILKTGHHATTGGLRFNLTVRRAR